MSNFHYTIFLLSMLIALGVLLVWVATLIYPEKFGGHFKGNRKKEGLWSIVSILIVFILAAPTVHNIARTLGQEVLSTAIQARD